MPTSDRQVRVSYIISTKNRARFLEAALQNVREFITPEDELIIMDGASTDETSEVAGKHTDIVDVFRSEPDSGEAHGYNKGILESRGRYVKFITDDDYIYPEAMRKVIAVMDAHPEVDAVLCGGESYVVDGITGEKRFKRWLRLPDGIPLSADIQNIMVHVTCGVGLVLTRSVIGRIGLLDTSFRAVDTDYMGRLFAAKADFKYLDIILFRHVGYPHSGQNDRSRCWEDRARILLREGMWNSVINSAEYPVETAAKVLGLRDLADGSVLAVLIWRCDRFRGSRWPVLRWLLLLVSGLERLRQLRWALSRPRRRTPSTVRPASLEDPKWDGALR